MKQILLVIIGVADLFANLPYIIDTYKGKTKPNTASWSTWTLLNGIAVFAAIAAGSAFNTVILSISYLLGSTSILIIAFWKGARRYTKFDGICQVLAIIGIVLWGITKDPNIALLFVIISSELSALPTLRHAYMHPDEETSITFLVAGITAFLTLCLASNINFAALALPIDLMLSNLLLYGIIIVRRRSHRPSEQA